MVELPPPYTGEAGLADWVREAHSVAPRFPNWERSFVSGHESPLFEVTHYESKAHPEFMISEVKFLLKSEGPPGHVHGGASAALLDETLGVSVWHAGHFSVTESLHLYYGRALPLHQPAYVVSKLSKTTEKTIEIMGTIFDQEKTPYVSAQGVFHRLTLDQLQRFNELKNKA